MPAPQKIFSFVPEHSAEPECGPLSARYEWCCVNGCGPCEAKLVEFRYYHQVSGGETTAQRTEPRLVSSCCGGEMEIWDNKLDTFDESGCNGELVKTIQERT